MSPFWPLVVRSFLDSWLLLLSCALLLPAFLAFRIWVAAQINFDAVAALLAGGQFQFFENLLPVPLAVIATATGRVAIGYEEFPVILLTGLWTLTRGTECMAGRLQDGTLEMLLAQPVRRSTLVTSHSAMTLAGIGLLATASWLGTAGGVAIASFAEPPPPTRFLPAALNLASLAIFMAGAATFASAWLPTRSRAVGAVVGVLVVELMLLLMSRASPQMAWLQAWTILAAYDPTVLTIEMMGTPPGTWPDFAHRGFWVCNGWLVGLGGGLWVLAWQRFCSRDVPAPA